MEPLCLSASLSEQGRDHGHTADQGQDENLGIQRYIAEETWLGPKGVSGRVTVS